MGRNGYSREKGTAGRWAPLRSVRHATQEELSACNPAYAATYTNDRTSAQSYASAPTGGAVPDFRFDPYWAEAWLLTNRQRAPEFRATLSKVPC